MDDESVTRKPISRESPDAMITTGLAAYDEVAREVLGAGTITRRQTTYLDLRARAGPACRVHFRDKVELAIGELDYPSVVLVDDHPLLTDYTEPGCALYIAGEQSERRGVVAQVERVIRDATQGWRALRDYRRLAEVHDVVRAGHGLFMNGPQPVCQAVAEVLEAADLRCSTLAGAAPRGVYRALILGRSYVIARTFAFELRA
jgi:hypothetical protein